MSIQIGDKKIKEINYGDRKISAVYYGSKLVYEAKKPDEEVNENEVDGE